MVNYYKRLHLRTLKTPILQGKKMLKSVKSIVVLSTYVVLTTIVLLFPVFSKTGERHCLRVNLFFCPVKWAFEMRKGVKGRSKCVAKAHSDYLVFAPLYSAKLTKSGL